MGAIEYVPAALANGLAGEVVRTFGQLRLRAFGTSMAPTILPGDVISIQRANLHEIFPGEVVLFLQDGRLFVHRVVRCPDGAESEQFLVPHLITRGDRLLYDDPPVLSGHLLGRVTSVQRGKGEVEFGAQPGGWRRMIARLLQISDYATYFYVRMAAWPGGLRGSIRQGSVHQGSVHNDPSVEGAVECLP